MPGKRKTNTEWQKVFMAAIALAKKIRKEHPNLTYPQAVKKAWKDPDILRKKKEYQDKHGVSGGAPRKRRVVKRRTTTVKRTPVKRRVAAKKTTRVAAKKTRVARKTGRVSRKKTTKK